MTGYALTVVARFGDVGTHPTLRRPPPGASSDRRAMQVASRLFEPPIRAGTGLA